jgi:hypothetical protein
MDGITSTGSSIAARFGVFGKCLFHEYRRRLPRFVSNPRALT